MNEQIILWAILRAVKYLGHHAEITNNFFQNDGNWEHMNEQWFINFNTEWGLSRCFNINGDNAVEGCLEQARAYLIENFNALVEQNGHLVAQDIDELTTGLADVGLSRGRATSAVSKYAFSGRPAEIFPIDSTAVRGLRCLAQQAGGNFVDYGGGEDRYQHFYNAWLVQYNNHEAEIENLLQDQRVQNITCRLGFLNGNMQTTAFKRKVFDNILMIKGGRVM
ncbi:MAG: hypothetical protein WD185_08915 [Sneathiella sp.]